MKRPGLTHTAAAATAFGAAWFLTGFHPSEAGLTRDTGRSHPHSSLLPERSERGESKPLAPTDVRARLASDDYRAAWETIGARRLSQEERFKVQVELLKRWAEVDLRGALDAALAEPWDGEGRWRDGAAGLLQTAFQQVFVDRSGDVWAMIREQRFGPLATALVRDAWSSALSREDPALFLSYLPEMEGIALRNAVRQVSESWGNRGQARQLWDALEKQGNLGPDAALAYSPLARSFASSMSPAEIRARLAESGGPLREIACTALAMSLCLPDVDFDFSAEMADLPDDLRDRFAAGIMENGYGRKESVVPAIDYLAEHGNWDVLAGEDARRQVINLSRNMEPAELADWVNALPARPETAELFHRGVEPFIQQDRDAAWEWMSGLESGMWRDRAFAEYSQQALNRFNDPEASRQALDRIDDPAFQQTAERWRKDWERAAGFSPQ